MRVRHNPHADEAILESKYCENSPAAFKGRWREHFGNDNPIHIEVGMGKGNFITTLASQNPNINYIGIERVPTILYKAEKKLAALGLNNLILVVYNAETINELFDTDEIDRIYLNFSDPWPKDRHAHRRLTSPAYLKKYDLFLKKEGHIEFKTDNRPLFDWSLESAPTAGWKLRDITYNLHSSEFNEGNIMTEYEAKFSGMGTPINRVVIYR